MNKNIVHAHLTLKNNSKKVLMSEALKRFKGKKDNSQKNIIHVHNGSYCVTVSPDNKAVARQFYDSADGLITYSIEKDRWFLFNRSQLKISKNPTRISPDGEKAFNASGDFKWGFKV